MKVSKEIFLELFDLFSSKGGDNYFGEEVTQYEHACQTAMLARKNEASVELQQAAFLHDIGHILPNNSSEGMMDSLGNINHEKLGAAWLKDRNFSELTIQVVVNHVDAKRYLCFTNQDYIHSLSDSSRVTLLLQGGAMTEGEAILFEQNPYFSEIIQIRKWDDLAKESHIIAPKLAFFIEELFPIQRPRFTYSTFEKNIFLE
jgi:2-amino-1-hydroxyethylphosphonate dioxygenase (glycine-forming)